MFNYSFTKAYTANKLIEEIGNAGIPMMSMDLISNTQFIVNVANQLTNAQLLTLNQVIASHVVTSSMVQLVADKIIAARAFGIGVIARYGAQNVLAGYDIATIQAIMIKTAKVQAALNTGSLYVAISEINAIEPDGVIITVEKLTHVRNEIEDYLQIPRT